MMLIVMLMAAVWLLGGGMGQRDQKVNRNGEARGFDRDYLD